MGLFDIFTETIGVDPGSNYLRIVWKGELVFNEPSQISFDTTNHDSISGIGNAIRITKNDTIIRPIDYTIRDFYGFETLFREVRRKRISEGKIFHKSYKIYFCVPSNLSEVEKRAYRDIGEHSGGVEVYMIHQCCSAAIGLNILSEKRDFVLIDFSFSKVEITVFAEAIPIFFGISRIGINRLFKAIRNFFLRNHKMDVTDNEIESIIADLELNRVIRVQLKTIPPEEIHSLLDHYFVLLNDELLEAMEHVSNHPALKRILNNGVYITGGGVKYAYLTSKIKQDEIMQCHLSKTPFLDNILGLKKVVENAIDYKNYLMT